jgi:hypothetical protein
MDDDTTTIDLPSTECALVTSDNMEGLHFTFPNKADPEGRDRRAALSQEARSSPPSSSMSPDRDRPKLET